MKGIQNESTTQKLKFKEKKKEKKVSRLTEMILKFKEEIKEEENNKVKRNYVKKLKNRLDELNEEKDQKLIWSAQKRISVTNNKIKELEDEISDFLEETKEEVSKEEILKALEVLEDKEDLMEE